MQQILDSQTEVFLPSLKSLKVDHDIVDSEEAVVLAQWLEMITLKVASEDPTNTHAQLLGLTPCLFPKYKLFGSLSLSLSLGPSLSMAFWVSRIILSICL